MRKILFWIALVVAAVIGHFAYNSIPDFINWIAKDTLSPGYLLVLKDSLAVALSGKIALAVIAFSILGLVIPAIYEALTLNLAAEKLKSFPPESSAKSTTLALEFEAELGDYRLIEEAIPAYAKFLVEQDDTHNDSLSTKKRNLKSSHRLKALVPAETFFGPNIFVEEHLLGWLFRPLASLLLGCGLIIFTTTCLIGFHNYREALPLDPVGGAGILWSWVEKGLFSLGFAATGALITLIITRVTFGLRTSKVMAFCRLMDAKFTFTPPSAALSEMAFNSQIESRRSQEQLQRLSIDFSKSFEASQQELAKKLAQSLETLEFRLSRSIESSLRPSLEKLTEASGQVSGKQSEMTANVIKTALDAFVKDLEKEVGGQFRKTNTLLKSTVALSAKLEKGFLGSLKDLAKQGDSQSNAISLVAREINQTLKGLKEFEKALEKAVTSIQPTLDKVLENQSSLSKALADEKSASHTLKDAATEMGKAAKASKDTIESFITLAENLKETSRSLSAPRASGNSPLPRPAKTSEGAGQGSALGSAIRGLRDKAEKTGKLPKL